MTDIACSPNGSRDGKPPAIGWHRPAIAKDVYAFAKAATPAARELLTQPVQDTLHFAGEALYSGPAMGTVEAALVSGRDMATRM